MRCFSLANLQRLSLMLLAIVLLQCVGSTMGTHQWHSGTQGDEELNHSHLVFTAQVTSLDECVECTCPVEAPNHEPHPKVQTTELHQLDLCLDCKCHGGHPSLMSFHILAHYPVISTAVLFHESDYLSVVGNPAYRPPIA